MFHAVVTLVAGLVVAGPAQAPPPSNARELICGGERMTLRVDRRTATVTVGGRTYEMTEVRTASGAKYEVPGDRSTSFWSQGNRGTLVVAGKTLPECAPASPAFTAMGNEPGWRLDIVDGRLTLVTDYGAKTTTLPTPAVETLAGGRRYAGVADGRSIAVTVRDRVCEDTMTGMPRPNAVAVTVDGTTLTGCGGDPASLLQGSPWLVRDLAGTAPVGTSRITVSFEPDGRISGHASCNRYSGEYTLTGEGLRIGMSVSSTRTACPPPLLAQEAAFLGLLASVERFELRPDGALILHAGQRTITARRE
jgi:heat shock protein HslJ/membrane-bound inhibitor of C-type lysozyme